MADQKRQITRTSEWPGLGKYLHLILALLFAGALASSLAWSKEKEVKEGVMELRSREFDQRYLPPVSFDHYRHENIIRCRVCHHDFYVFSDRNEGKGSKCSSCHKRQLNKEIPVPLLMAFHKTCIGCHENSLKWGRRSGPVMCGICHKVRTAKKGG